MEKDSIGLPKILTVGEVARRSGVAVSTVHFYEAKGLISSWRSEGNQRRYPREVLRRIAVIRVAQRTGIPLETIRESLSRLPEGRTLSAAQWKTLSAQWRDELDKRIRTLTSLRDDLGRCIGCGCLSMKDCPLRNPGDRLGQSGAGPMILEPDGGADPADDSTAP